MAVARPIPDVAPVTRAEGCGEVMSSTLEQRGENIDMYRIVRGQQRGQNMKQWGPWLKTLRAQTRPKR